jgi:hypothetical protein
VLLLGCMTLALGLGKAKRLDDLSSSLSFPLEISFRIDRKWSPSPLDRHGLVGKLASSRRSIDPYGVLERHKSRFIPQPSSVPGSTGLTGCACSCCGWRIFFKDRDADGRTLRHCLRHKGINLGSRIFLTHINLCGRSDISPSV